LPRKEGPTAVPQKTLGVDRARPGDEGNQREALGTEGGGEEPHQSCQRGKPAKPTKEKSKKRLSKR